MSKRRLLLPLVAGAAGYFAVFGGEYSAFEVWRLGREQARETARLEALRDTVAALRAHADSLESDLATLERLARERYGLIRDGERLYRFAPDSRAAAPGGGQAAR